MAHELADDRFMQEALALACRALGRTAPNPAVGAAVVRDGVIVGRGWTQPAGGPLAETVALTEAGYRARGATLYVTLEPCAHHGRTPPCVDAIIAAGIARCVVAVADPFPLVAGKGLARLRGAGIEVDVGVGAREAAEHHAGFFTRVRVGRPLVVAKYAMTLDGRIATRTGQSRWITGDEARLAAHRLRDRADAIMVGSGTVIADDPALTTRLPADLAGDGGPHHPVRVIADGRGVSPPTARVFDPTLPGRTLLATTAAAPPAWLATLERHGVERLACGNGPRVDLPALLDALGTRGINTLLVEGGSRLLGALFDAGLVDRVAAFIAPVIVGGTRAPGPVGGQGLDIMDLAWRLEGVQVQRLGADLLVAGVVVKPPAAEVA